MSLVYPTVCIQRSFACHVRHGTGSRGFGCGGCPGIPGIPAVVEGVNICAVYIIQFTCFKKIWRLYFNKITGKRNHVTSKLYNSCTSRKFCCTVACFSRTKRKPAISIFINNNSRIKRIRTVGKSISSQGFYSGINKGFI